MKMEAKKWTYEAIRTVDGVKAFVVVQNGDEVTHRVDLPHIVKHSPTGFEMGYGGSGPADLSYSILTHWLLSYGFTKAEAEEQAWVHHQAFKWTFVAKEHDRLSISDDVIEEWWIGEQEEYERYLAGQEKGANQL
jgi:hypothetical protein